MLLREALSPPRLERRPEPIAEMDRIVNAGAYDQQGPPAGPLLPIVHLNALATSRLVRRGGCVLDLGSGSGRNLAYLARCRPDLRIIGIELAETMVSIGRRYLADCGLSERVELRLGDMTCFRRDLDVDVDLVSSIFALHHLPTADHLAGCLDQIGEARRALDCAVWIFDHARPRHPDTALEFPELFTPDAPRAFKEDSSNSLRASWSLRELSEASDAALGGETEHRLARWMRLYQAHWTKPPAAEIEESDLLFMPPRELQGAARRSFAALRWLLPGIPTAV
jgi:SAM-dependent methyltransferase